MKTLILLTLVVIAVFFAHAQADLQLKWTVTMKVVDENGQPVGGADASVDYGIAPGFLKPGQRDWDKIEGLTDTNGVFVASHANTRTFTLGIQAVKDGYYKTRIGYDLSPYWNPNPTNWNPTITLTLKKVGEPIALYAKSVNLGMPAFDKPIGFDLMIGDWVAPYGRGINTDVIFTGHFDKRTGDESDYTLTVSFPEPGDGIQEFHMPDTEKGSELRSPHEAPADDYRPQWVQTDNRKPGISIKTNRDANRNYFFRVRTVLDDQGKVKSALYGKIYGDFMKFTYYLNPTPNSRNVEFDPKQNLFKNLKFDEGVKEP